MTGAQHSGEDVEADGAHWSPCHLWSQWRNRLLNLSRRSFTQISYEPERAMSKSKNTTNGASWKRRSVTAVAAVAMAFTALSAAPSQASEVAEEEAAYGWYFEQKQERPDRSDRVSRPMTSMMRGGGWA